MWFWNLLKSLKAALNPTVLLIILGTSVASGTVGYWRGARNTDNRITAEVARLEETRQATYDAALAATAAEIAKIRIVNTTVRQELEREVRTEKAYLECTHSDDTLRLLNAVLSGEATPESLDSLELPATQPTDR